MVWVLWLMSGCATVPVATPVVNVAEAMRGTWTVDLRADPQSEPYTKPFVVESVDEANHTFTGSFYESEISWARFNTAWGKLVVTFITSDGAGEYVHTATLVDGAWVGSSTAKHRNLLVPWTAKRSDR